MRRLRLWVWVLVAVLLVPSLGCHKRSGSRYYHDQRPAYVVREHHRERYRERRVYHRGPSHREYPQERYSIYRQPDRGHDRDSHERRGHERR
ncbi:MAG TPA: hypothetical protein VM243_07220 [Phycisphaerae bacterium]|nr:hypothetical protein [Phycisphaerae bacterium]